MHKLGETTTVIADIILETLLFISRISIIKIFINPMIIIEINVVIKGSAISFLSESKKSIPHLPKVASYVPDV